jgi:CheY-like chemotaxis protein
LLAGRKLLLADDSITIQKVVDLTFADEGVKVVCFSNGREAIEKLEEVAPDVVLADVFMPEINGYQVCEYIKQNDKFKHIPVILLVGSFEPFDEAEARRVGADDTLTKPFQSIRRLIDKVGGLMGGRPASEGVATLEEPQLRESPSEPEAFVSREAKVDSVDTRPLAEEVGRSSADQAHKLESQIVEKTEVQHEVAAETHLGGREMQIPVTELRRETSPAQDSGEILLDLGDFEQRIDTGAGGESVLDLGLIEDHEASTIGASSYTQATALAEAEVSQHVMSGLNSVSSASSSVTIENSRSAVLEDPSLVSTDPLATTQEWMRSSDEQQYSPVATESAHRRVEGAEHVGKITLDQLAPEVIDAIARRAVEQLSEKVVQEIAWEVVPQLAELLIKRRLEEKESQAK